MKNVLPKIKDSPKNSQTNSKKKKNWQKQSEEIFRKFKKLERQNEEISGKFEKLEMQIEESKRNFKEKLCQQEQQLQGNSQKRDSCCVMISKKSSASRSNNYSMNSKGDCLPRNISCKVHNRAVLSYREKCQPASTPCH